jgi:hypothetical protein
MDKHNNPKAIINHIHFSPNSTITIVKHHSEKSKSQESNLRISGLDIKAIKAIGVTTGSTHTGKLKQSFWE